MRGRRLEVSPVLARPLGFRGYSIQRIHESHHCGHILGDRVNLIIGLNIDGVKKIPWWSSG